MPIRISSPQWSWLERESERWCAEGLVDPQTRARILADYQPPSTERRGLLALVVVAVLMCGIGLLLLIGYNWDRIPPAAKIGMILAAVAGAFGGAAISYARARNVLGETLAFAGTLIFGNAIWLIAQVLHIQGHFPDAFFWFGLGALACAWLVGSTWIGVEAVVLSAAWILAESAFAARPIYTFIPIAAASLLLAYRLLSPVVLSAAALSAALWVAIATSDAPHTAVMPAAVVLAGSTLFGTGRLVRGDDDMRRAWQICGLLVLLVAFVPLMVTGAHETFQAGASRTSIAIGLVVGILAISTAATNPSTAADAAVAATTVVVPIWAAAVWSGVLPAGAMAARVGAIAFSVLALSMGLSLIRTALHSRDRGGLAFGVLFALAFLIVRWVSVIENMLWSGAFLIVAGGGLLVLARLWHDRGGSAFAAGRS